MSQSTNTPSTSAPWVDGLTIGEALSQTANRYGDREAMVFPKLNRRWTWGQLKDEVDRTARGLLAMGIRPGEHVALWATNVPEWIVGRNGCCCNLPPPASERCWSTSIRPIDRSS